MNDGRVGEADTVSLGRALAALMPSVERAFAPDTNTRGAYAAGPLSPVPDEGIGIDQVVTELGAYLENAASLTSPGFCPFIVQGPTTASVAARVAGAVGGVRYFLHSMNHLEKLGLRWLAEVCGVPISAAGVFVSGGSVANLVALGAARQHAWESRGIDVAELGVEDATPVRIYASELAHRTIHRSAAVLGLGRRSVVSISVDRTGRMSTDALRSQMAQDVRAGYLPVAVVAVAGTTDLGSIDPISEIVEVARDYGCWVHVDGAYGLPAYSSEPVRRRFDGLADADSWIVDPHKWLSTGPGIAAAFVRDGTLLTRAFDQGHAAYLEDAYGDEGHAVVPTTQSPASGPISRWSSRRRRGASSYGRCCAKSDAAGSRRAWTSTSPWRGYSRKRSRLTTTWSWSWNPSSLSSASVMWPPASTRTY